jgi:hypothetical protein
VIYTLKSELLALTITTNSSAIISMSIFEQSTMLKHLFCYRPDYDSFELVTTTFDGFDFFRFRISAHSGPKLSTNSIWLRSDDSDENDNEAFFGCGFQNIAEKVFSFYVQNFQELERLIRHFCENRKHLAKVKLQLDFLK